MLLNITIKILSIIHHNKTVSWSYYSQTVYECIDKITQFMSRAAIFSFMPILTKLLPESVTSIERGRYYRNRSQQWGDNQNFQFTYQWTSHSLLFVWVKLRHLGPEVSRGKLCTKICQQACDWLKLLKLPNHRPDDKFVCISFPFSLEGGTKVSKLFPQKKKTVIDITPSPFSPSPSPPNIVHRCQYWRPLLRIVSPGFTRSRTSGSGSTDRSTAATGTVLYCTVLYCTVLYCNVPRQQVGGPAGRLPRQDQRRGGTLLSRG